MIKNAFWNALSILVFITIIGVIALFGLIFLNPYSGLNPFPPPTMPAAFIRSTSTPTFVQLPPTWTPGSQYQQVSGSTLRPSSTPLETTAPIVLNKKTAIPTPTVTHTPTQTATRTATGTSISGSGASQTPNMTWTTTAQTATSAVLTAQAGTATAIAKTATAQAGGPGATQTVNAMPSNPASAIEANGASSDTWQERVSDPAFTWSPVSGASGYYVYWGSEPGGTSSSKVSVASYDPPAVTVGTYYLRLRTIFPWGARPDWTTVFIFRFDDTSPSAPNAAVETHGASSGAWQRSVPDPAFTWSGASDTGSGIARYDVYFGSNPNGTYVVAQPVSASYDPLALESGTYYLRVRAADAAGHLSDWASLFIFKYDGTPPAKPANLQTADPQTDSTPTFGWSASSDAHSGLAGYEIFWGSGSTCGSKNQPDQTGTSFTAPEISTAGEYLLCVRARDNSGNASDWAQKAFTYAP